MRKFEELVKQYYEGPDELEFILHLNSELGLEKDYFAYMSQGISVDYAIVAPSHMSTFSQMAPLMDMPFLFRDLDHWNKVLASRCAQADRRRRRREGRRDAHRLCRRRHAQPDRQQAGRDHRRPRALPIRVMGAPIQTRIFEAIKAAPTVIAYDEVYNAIQTGVIDAAENEAAGIEQMKFYEVGPEISLTQHAITVRPLCFSGKTFERLPEDLQAAILKAGKEAGAYGRELEFDPGRGEARAHGEGRLARDARVRGARRAARARRAGKQAYAEELGAERGATRRSTPSSRPLTIVSRARARAPARAPSGRRRP